MGSDIAAAPFLPWSNSFRIGIEAREEAILRELSGCGEAKATAGEHHKRLDHLTALSRRFCTTDDADDLKRLCTEVIDWFVRQSVGHDAAIKGILDDRLRRPQHAL